MQDVCVQFLEIRSMNRDLLGELIQLRKLESRRIVGLMSGTSADGIDAALVEVRGHGLSTRVNLLGFETRPIDRALKERIWRLPDDQSANICELNFLLGEAFAAAAHQVVDQTHLSMTDVHLIGSHGQTARHQPLSPQTQVPSTLQIGEGAVIAERTGCPVICDFRVADVAAGGQGAPLIPLVDYLLFRPPQDIRLTLNLGGIANITMLHPDLGRVMAFDTGPANMAIDTVARVISGWNLAYDRDGALASRGAVDQPLLAELLNHPYLALAPPKSTGRETFGRDFIYPLMTRMQNRLEDLLTTLSQFTVESIGLAYDRFIFPQGVVQQMYVSGGGVHNPFLMERLSRRLSPMPVSSIADLGMDPDAKEAVAFAVLANEALFCNPGNVPSATGAQGPRVLGKFVLPPLA